MFKCVYWKQCSVDSNCIIVIDVGSVDVLFNVCSVEKFIGSEEEKINNKIFNKDIGYLELVYFDDDVIVVLLCEDLIECMLLLVI